MTAFVRCRRLRDRDYFDPDYDLRFDDREQHVCLFYKRLVIPHDECKTECPGYIAVAQPQPSTIPQIAVRTIRDDRKPLKVSCDNMRKEIEQTARGISKQIPSESALAVAKSRADDAERRRQAHLAQQRTPIEQKIFELEGDLIQNLREMARDIVILDQFYSRPVEEALRVISQYGTLNSLAHPLVKSLPVRDLVQLYAAARGISVTRNPLIKQTMAIHEEIERLKQAPVGAGVPGVMVEIDAKQSSTEQRTYIEMVQRRDILLRIVALLESKLTASLERCSDPLQVQEISGIRRHLDVAKRAGIALPQELKGIEAQLREMRAP